MFSMIDIFFQILRNYEGSCGGRDRMVVRFTTTCAISTYHH